LKLRRAASIGRVPLINVGVDAEDALTLAESTEVQRAKKLLDVGVEERCAHDISRLARSSTFTGKVSRPESGRSFRSLLCCL
jgi:hypothetical protein